MTEIEYEHRLIVTAVNDGNRDYYVRLATLVDHKYNVVQLKKMERVEDGRKLITLGPHTDTIMVWTFMKQAKSLGLQVELS